MAVSTIKINDTFYMKDENHVQGFGLCPAVVTNSKKHLVISIFFPKRFLNNTIVINNIGLIARYHGNYIENFNTANYIDLTVYNVSKNEVHDNIALITVARKDGAELQNVDSNNDACNVSVTLDYTCT